MPAPGVTPAVARAFDELEGPITRERLSDHTSATRTDVQAAVNELIRTGVVREVEGGHELERAA